MMLINVMSYKEANNGAVWTLGYFSNGNNIKLHLTM